MSRSLLAGADGALQAPHVDEVVFLEFDFLSGVSRVCSREHSLEWNGFTWLGAGRVGSIEALQEGGELEARGIAMTLSGLTPGLLATALTPSEYKGRAVRMWCGQIEESRYLSLPGAAGNYASTPDSVAVDLTGSFDLRVKVAANDWTPAGADFVLAKDMVAKRSFAFGLKASGLYLESYDSAGTGKLFDSSAAPSVADGSALWIRIACNWQLAGNITADFYTSPDGVTWAALGVQQSLPATGNGLGNFDNPVHLGQREYTGNNQWCAGKFYYAEVRNGINGPVVAKFDASLMSPRQVSAQMPTGEVWTVNQNGTPNAHIERDAATIVPSPVGPFLFKMDQLSFQLGQTATIRLTAESRLADWMRPRVRRYNNADHQTLYPADKFFEHTEKQVEAVHLW